MIPSAFVFLDSLPLVGPGKLNLRALPSPGRGRPELDTPFAFPRTPVEEKIAEDLGAASGRGSGRNPRPFLGAGRRLAARQPGSLPRHRCILIEVPLRTLFDTPTVADMAAVVQRNLADQTKPEAIERVLTEVEGLSETAVKSAAVEGSEVEIPRAERVRSPSARFACTVFQSQSFFFRLL